MPKSYISQITVGSTTYDLKDLDARQLISDLEAYSDYLGVTTTELTDGSTTNPITINGESVTAVKGNIVNYGSKEFIWNGAVSSPAWQEFGDLSALGALAYKSSAEATYTPAGTMTDPTVTVSTTPATVNSITDVGSLPSLSVTNEVLSFDAGSLPTKGSDQTVVGSVDSASASGTAFSGTQATITVS